MHTRISESISNVGADAWDRLNPERYPFLRHAFLEALESTGCVSAQSGWHPCHVLAEEPDGTLVGALPMYLKTNPYGEFVFDFAWANAYDQAGLAYYPKLVNAIPFTPAGGPRVLIAPDGRPEAIGEALLSEAVEFARRNELSSLHTLFPDARDRALAESFGMLMRKDCQFHWHNRGYTSFDEFLQTFTATKRKKTKRERRRIREAGIRFRVRDGNALSPRDWDAIVPLYANTFLRRGRRPYLDQAFFEKVSEAMPDNIVVFEGWGDDELVSVAICFRSETTLYGRYWGASRFVDSLHFETCYYQGIDYCIEHGLQVFEPGTQGEHKIARGFVPVETWSAHWLSHPQFSAAVDEFLERERAHIDRYIDVLGEHVPYKSESH